MAVESPLWPRAPGSRFITLEGVDGAGKSSQLKRLAAHLRGRGAAVLETREPGGAPGAEEIRQLLVEGEPGRWSGETETLLFTAARRDHVERTIAPALTRGEVVLCDRYVDSTRAYQGARGASRDLVELLHRSCVGLDPDLTVVLDLDPEEGLRRGAARGGGEARFEALGLTFQQRLRAAFHALAAVEPDRVRLVDASGDEEDVATRVAEAVA